MMAAGLTWAAWTAEAILVGRQSESVSPTEIERVVHRTPASLRYFIRLYRCAGEVLLRCGEGAGTSLDVAAVGGNFQAGAISLPPDLASLAPYQVLPLGDGSVAGLPDDERLLLWQRGGPVLVRALPLGFHARAVQGDGERIYVAGSVKGGRLRSESRRHALAVSIDRGESWQVDERVHGGLMTAWRSLLRGGEGEYRTVTVVGERLVLTAEVGDLGEESTFVFVRDGRGRWTSVVIADDVFRAAVSDGAGAVQIVSHRAARIVVDDEGRVRRSDLGPRIAKLLGDIESPPPAGARFEILGVDALASDVALLVSIQVPAATGLARLGEAVIVFGADGDEAVRVQRAPAPELVSACFGG